MHNKLWDKIDGHPDYKIDEHPDYKKIQGCQESEQKPDNKETCYGDVTRTANERPVFKSRDFLRPMRGRYCGDTESWHRVIRHGRNINVINVIVIIKNTDTIYNISVPFNQVYKAIEIALDIRGGIQLDSLHTSFSD